MRTAHNRTHGKTRTKIYYIWRDMLNRCRWEKGDDFPQYGGRGITVCDRWLKFENFYSDMGDPPEGTQLDRRENDGNYEPGNCRWASRAIQNRNRRSNIVVSYNGQTKVLMDWATEVGIKYTTLRARIFVHGWPVERAFTEAIHD